ncbi:MAG TPA: EF-hand domain-containing protein [bacterium]|nr:EF-hand domain-containing protein [bacterium]
MTSGISSYTSMLATQYPQMQQTQSKALDEMFAKIDTNSDGAIDQEEFTAFDAALQEETGETPGVDAFFTMNDTDSDGTVTKEEMAAPPPPPPPPGGTGGPGGMGGAGGGGKDDDDSSGTDPLDTNGDGTVSIEEYIAGILTESSDASGQLNIDELIANLSANANALAAYGSGSYSDELFSTLNATA